MPMQDGNGHARYEPPSEIHHSLMLFNVQKIKNVCAIFRKLRSFRHIIATNLFIFRFFLFNIFTGKRIAGSHECNYMYCSQHIN